MNGKNLVNAAALFVALAAGAHEYIWRGGYANDSWTAPENWTYRGESGSPTQPPGAGDSVWVAINIPMILDVSDADSLAVLNNVDIVHLAESTSRFTINVPAEADVTISTPIAGGYGTGQSDRGELEVTGAGTLRLSCTNNSAYLCKKFKVDGATLWAPQSQELAWVQYSFGNVTVTNGATFYLPARHDGSKNNGNNYVNMTRLYGDGTVTAAETTELRFTTTTAPASFSGVLGAKINIFSGGVQYLTGTNTVMATTAIRVHGAKQNWSTSGGVIGVMKFGKAGEPSSIGIHNAFRADVNGATYIYLGKGEETDKYFYVHPYGNAVNSIDGGPYGGLEFVGANAGVYYDVVTATTNNNLIVGLNGSNTTACVFRGCFSVKDKTRHMDVVKKGTGIWRFADPAADGLNVGTTREFHGSISVDEGVLQFDTIAPIGEPCSVGRATSPKGAAIGNWNQLPDVDWAFSLGGTNAALKALAEGTLEYTGTRAGLADRRRIRLEADGRLLANAAKHIRYRMAESTSTRAKTLTLDGTSTATNEVHDVTDTAAYPVSLVKQGTGTWAIGGNQSFHGDLVVKGGRLIVDSHPAGSAYTWFRFTVKDLFDPVGAWSKGPVSVRYLGFFDADGYCQTLDSKCSEDTFAASIQPGEAGYDTTYTRAKGSYSAAPNDDNITNLFNRTYVCDARFYRNANQTSSFYPEASKPDTWVGYVVRLTNGAPAIASYDWATTYGWTSGNKGGFHWMPCRWALEGSVDGIHWEDLNPDGGDYVINTNEYLSVRFDTCFVKSAGAYQSGSVGPSAQSPVRHTGGWEIRGTSTNSYSVLSNVRSLRVDSGATLEWAGSGTITNFVVDVTAGCGTIKGTPFAAAGTVKLVNCAARSAFSLPCSIAGAAGSEANLANWSVQVDGQTRSRWHVRYADGALSVLTPGLTVNFR